MAKEQFAEGSPSSGVSVNRSHPWRQTQPSAAGSRRFPTTSLPQLFRRHIRRHRLATIMRRRRDREQYSKVPMSHAHERHGKAISMIQNKMEGFNSAGAPRQDAKPRCFEGDNNQQ